MVDFADTPEMATFREEVRTFVNQHHPKRLADEAIYNTGWGNDIGTLSGEQREELVAPWRAAMSEQGWISPALPKEYGGADLSPVEQFVLNEEFASLDATAVGIRQDLVSVLMLYGTEEQKAEHLPDLLSGKTRWAQGYSEPGSGSDLASLQTRATRDGDEFVVNGQKIWTSGAHRAHWLFGLFRTDPEAPKHRGISYLLMKMDSPGITPRPMEQMTGAAEFNEVFFEDVRVPVKNLIGELNRGWYVGATLLDFERSSIGNAIGTRKTLDELLTFLVDEDRADSGRSRLGESSVRAMLPDRYIDAEVAALFSYRVFTMHNRGLVPNYEASVGKVFNTEMMQRIGNTAVKALGLYGQLAGKDDERAPMRSRWQQYYMGAVAATIGGGTSEIQRNVIATRGLGLPRG